MEHLSNEQRHYWANQRVLVTGGMGFVGSNLTRALVDLGAKVTVLDNMLPGHGGNLFNLEGYMDRVRTNISDVTDRHSMAYLVQNQDIIFHLAGQVNHVASIEDPHSDLNINVAGTLTLIEACRQYNRDARIIFAGTRGSYGPSVRLPVDEEHPTRPMGVYAVTNLAAEQLLHVYHQVHGIRSVCLRITNTFGPRHQMRHNQYGVANWFIRLALENRAITVMGDGEIQRDLLYIDDLVRALLTIPTQDAVWGEVINTGTGTPTSFLQLAQAVIAAAETGRIEMVPFSLERRQLEPGSYYADVAKIQRLTGWQATVSLEEGLKRTIAYYKEHARHYWP